MTVPHRLRLFSSFSTHLPFFTLITNEQLKGSGSESEKSIESLDEGAHFLLAAVLIFMVERIFSLDEKGTSGRRKAPRRKLSQHRKPSEDGEDGGEDTDEGEVESREVDYFTDTSSDSEDERVRGGMGAGGSGVIKLYC